MTITGVSIGDTRGTNGRSKERKPVSPHVRIRANELPEWLRKVIGKVGDDERTLLSE
jgi:hypothetical protein